MFEKELKDLKLDEECLKQLKNKIKQIEERIKNEVVHENDIDKVKELQLEYKILQRFKSVILRR